MKIFKIINYIFFAFIALIVILLIISSFPITGNYKILVVESGSMQPAIKTGGIVVIKPEKEYKVGDIITFDERSVGVPITHRIFEIKENNGHTVYTTKGDANKSDDENLLSEKSIIGKVLFSIPYVGYAVDTVKRPLGFIVIIALPALLLIIGEVKNIWKQVKKIKQKQV